MRPLPPQATWPSWGNRPAGSRQATGGRPGLPGLSNRLHASRSSGDGGGKRKRSPEGRVSQGRKKGRLRVGVLCCLNLLLRSHRLLELNYHMRIRKRSLGLSLLLCSTAEDATSKARYLPAT